MRDYVTGFIFGMVCLLIGAALLYDAVSVRDPMQTETIGGAAVLSFGAVTLSILVRHRLKWKKELREYRGDGNRRDLL